MLTALLLATLAQADAGAWPLPVPPPAPVLAGRPSDANRVLTFNAAGMVTVGFGNNLWAGGENNVAFDVGGCYLPGATLTVDGQPLVKAGKLVGK